MRVSWLLLRPLRWKKRHLCGSIDILLGSLLSMVPGCLPGGRRCRRLGVGKQAIIVQPTA